MARSFSDLVIASARKPGIRAAEVVSIVRQHFGLPDQPTPAIAHLATTRNVTAIAAHLCRRHCPGVTEAQIGALLGIAKTQVIARDHQIAYERRVIGRIDRAVAEIEERIETVIACRAGPPA